MPNDWNMSDMLITTAVRALIIFAMITSRWSGLNGTTLFSIVRNPR